MTVVVLIQLVTRDMRPIFPGTADPSPGRVLFRDLQRELDDDLRELMALCLSAEPRPRPGARHDPERRAKRLLEAQCQNGGVENGRFV